MKDRSKLIGVMIFLLMFSMLSLNIASYYSQEDVDAPRIVKSVAESVDKTVSKIKIGGFSPSALGDFIPKNPGNSY